MLYYKKKTLESVSMLAHTLVSSLYWITGPSVAGAGEFWASRMANLASKAMAADMQLPLACPLACITHMDTFPGTYLHIDSAPRADLPLVHGGKSCHVRQGLGRCHRPSPWVQPGRMAVDVAINSRRLPCRICGRKPGYLRKCQDCAQRVGPCCEEQRIDDDTVICVECFWVCVD